MKYIRYLEANKRAFVIKGSKGYRQALDLINSTKKESKL